MTNQPNFKSGTVWVGDNLPVLRGMNSDCVDLIYLDPPFKSDRNYEAPIGSEAAGAAFKDMWTLDDIDVHEHGELAERNPAAYSVIEAARHTDGKGMMAYLIYMAVRLIEMHRILKPTGSIYLHCDDTAGHYLKLLMDGLFGSAHFKNEIVWKRTSGKGLNPTRYMRNVDYILFYAKSEKRTWNQQYLPYNEDHTKNWKNDPLLGKWTPADLSGGKGGSKSAYEEFNGAFPPAGRAWAPPKREKFPSIIPIPENYEIMNPLEKCKTLDTHNMIHWSKSGKPYYKKFKSTLKGIYCSSLIEDIPPVKGKESTNYPTQKPVKLLERIILSSSNQGDLVLDPFCGCATALVAADRLQRQWAGIDLSPLAVKLVNERIIKDRGPLWGKVIVPDQPPTRTDLGKLPNYRTHRHRLYGEQEGVCVGCNTHFPFRVMEVDHIMPQSRGGTDHPENLQLLCSGCNKSKGSDTMAEWRARQ